MAERVPVHTLRRVAEPRRLALGVGAGRAVIGVAFFAAPVTSVRMLGVDTATARRASWLARMAAARDLALGAGAVHAAVTERDVAPWLIAGAVADAGDAVAFAVAVRHRRVAAARGAVVAVGAAVLAGVAGWAAAADRAR